MREDSLKGPAAQTAAQVTGVESPLGTGPRRPSGGVVEQPVQPQPVQLQDAFGDLVGAVGEAGTTHRPRFTRPDAASRSCPSQSPVPAVASNALGNGIPITDVAEWMGHKSIEETYRTYRHLMPGSITKAARILDAGLWDAA
jgi:hypothetical protein